MILTHFIFLIILIGIVYYFDYRESKKREHANKFFMFIYRTINFTFLILITFSLFSQNVVYEVSENQIYHYKADNVTLNYIEIQPIFSIIPFNEELAILFLLISLYQVYWITGTFSRGGKSGR